MGATVEMTLRGKFRWAGRFAVAPMGAPTGVQLRRGDTHIEIRALNTASPCGSVTTTFIGNS